MTTPINPLPTPPALADSPTDFNTKAFALLGALPGFVTEANAQASGVDAAVLAAETEADAAALKAGEALTSANNAALSKTDADSARDAAVAAQNAAEAALDARLGALPQRLVPETWHPMRAWWWLIPFVAALGAEWWSRRRRGLA